MSNLTETVKARVDADLRAALVREANHTARSEGAVIRAALRAYLAPKGATAKETHRDR